MDYSIAIRLHHPAIQFIDTDGTYEGIIITNDMPKPTQAELDIAWARWLEIKAIIDTQAAEQAAIEQAAKERAEAIAALVNPAIATLDAMAETERLKYITDGAGKAMAYQQQRAELEAWRMGERNPERLPIATKLQGVMGYTLHQVMNMWAGNINKWLETGSLIEANLMKYKLEIRGLDSLDPSDYDEVMARVDLYASL